MKTIILITFAFCLFSISGFSQINSAETIKYQPHTFGVESSLGIGVRDNRYLADVTGFGGYGLKLAGFRYTRNFSPYLGWDAIKLKIFTTGHQVGLSGLSGIRLSTHRFGRKKTSYFYGAFRLGGAYYMDIFERETPDEYENSYVAWKLGYTHELEFGIHFKYMFFGPKYSFLNMMHYFGINVGVDIGRYAERSR